MHLLTLLGGGCCTSLLNPPYLKINLFNLTVGSSAVKGLTLETAIKKMQPSDLNSRNIEIRQFTNVGAKYLLFIRSGEIRPHCVEDYFPNSEIQVVISLYKEPVYTIPSDWIVIAGGVSKFDSARLLFERHPFLLNSDYFAFFDPDVEISFQSIHKLFCAGDSCNQYIYQAALDPNSNYSHEFLVKNDDRKWVGLSFVEVMAPFFSRKALLANYSNFSESVSTWGLEYGWYATNPRSKMSMNQEITMVHKSPVDVDDGPFYRYLSKLGVDPFKECQRLKFKYIRKAYYHCKLPFWVASCVKPEFFLIKSKIERVDAKVSKCVKFVLLIIGRCRSLFTRLK